MILGTDAIRANLALGAIACDPPPEVIEATHIDVHLGRYYWIRSKLAVMELDISTADPRACYTPMEATRGKVLLPPQSFVLCHTEEFIGTTVPWLRPDIDTRSTLARWGLPVHLSAGLGDPGFCGRWTLEVWNWHTEAILVPVGARVGSVQFTVVEGNEGLYTARYNVGRADWTPDAMLPRRGAL